LSDHPTLDGLDAAAPFLDRHVGPGPDDLSTMLERLGYPSLDALMEDAVPGSIRSTA
jgi:glycine dehydrogenase